MEDENMILTNENKELQRRVEELQNAFSESKEMTVKLTNELAIWKQRTESKINFREEYDA